MVMRDVKWRSAGTGRHESEVEAAAKPHLVWETRTTVRVDSWIWPYRAVWCLWRISTAQIPLLHPPLTHVSHDPANHDLDGGIHAHQPI